MTGNKRRRTLIAVVMALLVAVPIAVVATDRFTDVPEENVHHDDITWLADAEVTLGCNPPDNDEFCPGDPVLRQQMASFMRRLAENQVVDADTAITAESAVEANHAATADNATEADHATSADSAADAGSLEGYGLANFVGAQITSRLDEVPVPDGGQASAEASCQEGEVLIGGGGALSAFVADVPLLSSRPIPLADGTTPTAWRSSAINPAGGTGNINVRAWAMCAAFPDVPVSEVPQQQATDPDPSQP